MGRKYFAIKKSRKNVSIIKKINKKDLKEIRKNIFGSIFYKVGRVGVNSTDNIILSKYIGLGSVGLYSNYRLVVTSISSILNQIISSITASVGNIGKSNNKKIYLLFKRTYFATFCIYSFSTLLFYFLINDFISLWLGKEYVLANDIVILISINFFLNGINTIISVYRDAFGLYWKGKIKPAAEVIINLVFSIILVKDYGVYGVLLGTLISNITVNLWVEVYILYHEIFKEKLLLYFTSLLKYISILLIDIIILLLIFSLITINNLLLLLITKTILIIIVTVIIYILFFHKKDEFTYFLNIIKNIRKKNNILK